MPKKLRNKGQGLVEYAIILALIAIIVIVLLNVLEKKKNEAELRDAETASQQAENGESPEDWQPNLVLEMWGYQSVEEGPIQACINADQDKYKNILVKFTEYNVVEFETFDQLRAEGREYPSGGGMFYLFRMTTGESVTINGTLTIRNCFGGFVIENNTNIEWFEYTDGTKLGVVSEPQTVKFETASFDHFRECKAEFVTEGIVEIDSFGYVEKTEVDEAFAGIGQPFAVNIHLKGYYPLKLNYGYSTATYPELDHVNWWTDQQDQIQYQFAGGWDYHEWEGEILSVQLPTGQLLLVRFPSAGGAFEYAVVADKNCNPVQPPSAASIDIPQEFLPIVWGYKDACMRGDGNNLMRSEGAPFVYGSLSVSGNWRDDSTYVLEVSSEHGTFDILMGVDKQQGWINGLTGGQLWQYNYQSKTMTIALGNSGINILVYIPWFNVDNPLPIMYRIDDADFLKRFCG